MIFSYIQIHQDDDNESRSFDEIDPEGHITDSEEENSSNANVDHLTEFHIFSEKVYLADGISMFPLEKLCVPGPVPTFIF